MNGLPGMEAEFQAYKDYVNFVWVYGSEAHPDDKQLWESHGYASSLDETEADDTTSMEERANRAYQLKYGIEPNLGMPFIIDYINTSMGDDNLIRSTYGGISFASGAPNAGYIIDCDGTIILTEDWAWTTPGGALDHPSFEDLETFLNDYLNDPPDCYEAGVVDVDVDVDADADGDADGDPDCDEAPHVLDDSHYGWKTPNCGDCHLMPPDICHTEDSPDQCAACHGGNGATCPPVGEEDPVDHSSTANCQSCHGEKHDLGTESDCASCHYASAGVPDCPEPAASEPADSSSTNSEGTCGCNTVGEDHRRFERSLLILLF